MASKNRTDGDGSIYHDKTRDRWVGSYVIGWKGDKPIRRKVSGKSRTDAARKLRELKEKHAAGTLPIGRAPTVEEWLRLWIKDIAPNRVRPTTLATYRSRVENRLIPTLGAHRLDRLYPDHLESAWATLINDRGLTPGSVRVDHGILSAALDVAFERGLVKENVALRDHKPRGDDAPADVLSLAEARSILGAADNLERNQARWSVALSLGLRPGEALGLRWSDVDLDGGHLHIRHTLSRLKGKGLVLGPVKSKAGARTIAMPEQLHRQMKAHRLAQNAERLVAGTAWADGDYVFTQPDGRPLEPAADRKAWHALRKAAGVREVKLYASRHTAATLLMAQGVPPRVVMDMLGHSTLQMTTRYTHVADDMQREAMRRQGDALWGS